MWKWHSKTYDRRIYLYLFLICWRPYWDPQRYPDLALEPPQMPSVCWMENEISLEKQPNGPLKDPCNPAISQHRNYLSNAQQFQFLLWFYSVAASCDECEKRRDCHFFLLRRGGGGWEPVRRADGISVCLVCLKNTAGEAPSQTSQLHGPGWSQSFHCFPPWRHWDLIPSPISKSLHSAV